MKVKKLMLSMIDMPKRKIEYMIAQPTFVQGFWDTLAHYNIPHTKENHELLVELVQEKLEGPEIEREWTEREYYTFVFFKE